MPSLSKNKRYLKALILILLITFSTSGLAANRDSGRIMPGKKVLVFRGDHQVGELKAEAPFPDGALLECDGDCAVRMDSLLLVGADKSLFSVTTQEYSRELRVKQGTVYFAISKLPRSLVFVAPWIAVTVQRLILNAATDGGLLKGYVAVNGESAEIGVIEGGSLLVSTVAGETTIQSGNKMVLGQTDSSQTSAETSEAQTGESSAETTGTAGTTTAAGTTGVGGVAIAPIAAGVAVAVGIGIAAATGGGGGGGGGGGEDSPAAPPP